MKSSAMPGRNRSACTEPESIEEIPWDEGRSTHIYGIKR
jgi:hypothetical protein